MNVRSSRRTPQSFRGTGRHLVLAAVDDDGGFVVEVDPDVVIPTKFVDAGFVNFDLYLEEVGEMRAKTASTVFRVEQGGATVWRSDEAGGSAPLRIDFDLDQGTTIVTDSDGSSDQFDLP